MVRWANSQGMNIAIHVNGDSCWERGVKHVGYESRADTPGPRLPRAVVVIRSDNDLFPRSMCPIISSQAFGNSRPATARTLPSYVVCDAISPSILIELDLDFLPAPFFADRRNQQSTEERRVWPSFMFSRFPWPFSSCSDSSR